ncbi:diguanylate cyclase, partial [Myxococcota bacterium]|nr:diguanylate cyclase [Myxococcota bacterium]
MASQNKKPLRMALGSHEERSRFLDTMLESLTHPFYVIDTNTYEIILSNSAAIRDGVVGKTTCHFATHGRETPCDSDEHPCPLVEVKRTLRPSKMEHLHKSSDGTFKQVEVFAYPILDEEGEVTAMIEYSLDISARSEAEARLSRSAQNLERLNNLAQELSLCESESDIHHLAVSGAASLIPSSAAVYYLFSEELPKTMARFSFLDPRERGEGDEGSFSLPEAKKAYESQQTEVSEGSEKGRWISIPCAKEGVLQIFTTGDLSIDGQHILGLLQRHIYSAQRRVSLEKELKEKALFDSLTGLYNRHYMSTCLEHEIERSKRKSGNFGLIVADINLFKHINDVHGHQVGDEVIRGMGELLRENTRDVDVVIRYGGDEFLIIAPDAGAELDRLKERILNALYVVNQQGGFKKA